MRARITKDGGVSDYWTFTWNRWRDGYQFEKRAIHPWAPIISPADPKRKQLLISLVPPGATMPEAYRPLEDSGGFSREFSAIETPKDALRFANRYGLLGLGYVPRMQLHRDSDEAEQVSYWLMEAQRLRRLYNLWDLCQSNDIRSLGKMIQWNGNSVVVTFANGNKRCIAQASHKNPRWLNTWKRGDVLGPAKLFIAEEYNSQIDQLASPLLLLDIQGNLKPHSTPACLLGAIWLEFGEVASGVRKQAVCESCGRIMDVTENRSHKRMHVACSRKLRTARYRQAQKESKQNGKTKTRKR